MPCAQLAMKNRSINENQIKIKFKDGNTELFVTKIVRIHFEYMEVLFFHCNVFSRNLYVIYENSNVPTSTGQ